MTPRLTQHSWVGSPVSTASRSSSSSSLRSSQSSISTRLVSELTQTVPQKFWNKQAQHDEPFSILMRDAKISLNKLLSGPFLRRVLRPVERRISTKSNIPKFEKYTKRTIIVRGAQNLSDILKVANQIQMIKMLKAVQKGNLNFVGALLNGWGGGQNGRIKKYLDKQGFPLDGDLLWRIAKENQERNSTKLAKRYNKPGFLSRQIENIYFNGSAFDEYPAYLGLHPKEIAAIVDKKHASLSSGERASLFNQIATYYDLVHPLIASSLKKLFPKALESASAMENMPFRANNILKPGQPLPTLLTPEEDKNRLKTVKNLVCSFRREQGKKPLILDSHLTCTGDPILRSQQFKNLNFVTEFERRKFLTNLAQKYAKEKGLVDIDYPQKAVTYFRQLRDAHNLELSDTQNVTALDKFKEFYSTSHIDLQNEIDQYEKLKQERKKSALLFPPKL